MGQARRLYVLLAVVVLGLAIVAAWLSADGPADAPEEAAHPPPEPHVEFHSATLGVTFSLPSTYKPTIKDGEALATATEVWFSAQVDDAVTGLRLAACRESEARKCLPAGSQVIAEQKVRVAGTTGALQFAVEQKDSAGATAGAVDRILSWHTIIRTGDKQFINFSLHYHEGSARAEALADAYRAALAGLRLQENIR